MKDFLAKLSEKAKAFGAWVKNTAKNVYDNRSKFTEKVKGCGAWIVKTAKAFAAWTVKTAKASGIWVRNYISSVRKDTSKLILSIILAVAIILSCVAVISFGAKIVRGVTSIFGGNEPKSEVSQEAPADVQVFAGENGTAKEACENCQNGHCIRCSNGINDCPNCENGVCSACGGQKGMQNKWGSMLFKNCFSCRGSGECKTCKGSTYVDCKYCTDGACNTCTVQE